MLLRWETAFLRSQNSMAWIFQTDIILLDIADFKCCQKLKALLCRKWMMTLSICFFLLLKKMSFLQFLNCFGDNFIVHFFASEFSIFCLHFLSAKFDNTLCRGKIHAKKFFDLLNKVVSIFNKCLLCFI